MNEEREIDGKVWLVYLKDGIAITRKRYESWWELQDEYGDAYLKHRPLLTKEGVCKFLRADFGEPSVWPLSMEAIDAYFAGDELVIRS